MGKWVLIEISLGILFVLAVAGLIYQYGFRESEEEDFADNQSSNASIVVNDTNLTINTNVSENQTTVNDSQANQTSINQSNPVSGFVDLVVSLNYTATFLYNTSESRYYDLVINMVIKNNGTIAASACTTYGGLGSDRGSWVTPALGAGASYSIAADYDNLTQGDYNALARADWDEQIAESNENNNVATLRIEL